MFPWCDSPSFAVHFWLPPRKESLYNNVFCLSLCFTCHMSCTETEYLSDNRRIVFFFFCLVKENFVRHMQYAHEKLLVLNFKFKKKKKHKSHFTNISVAPFSNHIKRVCNWACLIKSFSCFVFLHCWLIFIFNCVKQKTTDSTNII